MAYLIHIWLNKHDDPLPDFDPLPLMQGSMASVLVWVGDISELIEGVSATGSLIYLLVIIGLIIMRITYKEEPRLFKVSLLLISHVCDIAINVLS